MTTGIEWVINEDGTRGDTYNWLWGCSYVSEACRNCYAARYANRFRGDLVKKVGGEIFFNGKVEVRSEDQLTKPLGRSKAWTYFVNDMSDTFHENVSFDVIDSAIAVMAARPQDTYMLLTKRPERMAEYAIRVAQSKPHDDVNIAAFDLANCLGTHGEFASWPLPNVWVGTTVENQEAADQRIPHLLECPAAIRFLSIEPLLGPINLCNHLNVYYDDADECFSSTGKKGDIDWVIIGCESLPGKRCGRLNDALGVWGIWVQRIIEQCRAAGVKVYVKQIPIYVSSKKRGEKRLMVTTDIEQFPSHLRIREMPERRKQSG